MRILRVLIRLIHTAGLAMFSPLTFGRESLQSGVATKMPLYYILYFFPLTIRLVASLSNEIARQLFNVTPKLANSRYNIYKILWKNKIVVFFSRYERVAVLSSY